MSTRSKAPTDPAERALRDLQRFGGSVYDSLADALAAHRADADAETRAKARELCLRRAERLCRHIIDSIAKVPR